MSQPCDRAGVFRGPVIACSLRKAEGGTQSKFFELRCAIHEYWNGEAWEDWRGYDMEAFGGLCIVKQKGDLNPTQLDPLIEHGGWDGDFERLVAGECRLNPLRFTTKAASYEKDGQTKQSFKIEWIDAYDSVPGSKGLKTNMDENEAKMLNAQLGGAIRARIGNAKRNAAPAAGRPAAPPPVASMTKEEIAAEAAKVAHGEIPF